MATTCRKSISSLGCAAVLGLLLPAAAQAQTIQRGTINASFEQPVIASGCQGYVYEARVPGWETTDPPLTSPTADFDAPNGCVGANGTNPPGGTRVFEYYSNTVIDNQSGLALTAADGVQFVELNAQTASRLYQNVCLVAGETLGFSFSHLGRRSPTVEDVARFSIGGSTLGSGTIIATASDSNDGVPGFATPGLSTNVVRVQGPSSGGAGRFWGNYSGSFVVPAVNGGVQQIAFEAVSSSTGNAAQGNFLDAVRITVLPAVELASATYTSVESNAPSPIQIRVVGTVPVGGLPVSLTVTGGTATLGGGAGGDYTINGGTSTTFTVTVPAGDYGAGQLFNIPMTVVNDLVPEPTETFSVTLNAAPTSYTLTSTAVCNSAGRASATYTIVDDDATVKVQKTTTNTAGGPFAFTVTNLDSTPAAITTTAANTPTPAAPAAHHVSALGTAVTLNETLPIGWTFASATCTDANAASTGNTVAITATTLPITIPASNVRVGADYGCVFTNTQIQAELSITKTNTPAAGPSDQAADTVTSGSATTYSIVVTNNGPGAANGAVLRDPAPTGLTCTTVTCGNPTNGAVCPAVTLAALQSTAGVTIATLPANGSLTFTLNCAVP